MHRAQVFAAFISTVCTCQWLTAAEVSGRTTATSLQQQVVAGLGDLDLSANQRAALMRLAGEYAPRFAELEQTCALNDAQRRSREKALLKIAREGSRGSNAARLLRDSVTHTPEQRAALADALRLGRAFERDVLAELTERQRMAHGDFELEGDSGRDFVIVELSPQLPQPTRAARTLQQAAAELHLTRLQALISEKELTSSSRVIDPPLLDRLRTNDPEANALIRQLRSFWRVNIRSLPADGVEDTIQRLNELPEIERAYRARGVAPASAGFVDPSDDPFFVHQGYLEASPQGIDAQAAWAFSSGTGSDVGLVDLEQGWNVDHEELRALVSVPVFGDICPGNDHGTGVLGEIMAADNTAGVVGAAPGIGYVLLSSRYLSNGTWVETAASVIAPLFVMNPGDVLLIEVQTTPEMLPVEVDDVSYLAIRLATRLQIIVIEAAGNGGHDLDAYTNSRSQAILNRRSPDFRDSGAVLVGASNPADQHNRANASCFGSRVDGFGWGNFVATSGGGDLDDGGGDVNRWYRRMFNGTSSAAAIEAGAAIVVQGLWKARYGMPLSPAKMRQILSDPRLGTSQGPDDAGAIGVMPDLKRIIAEYGLDQLPAPGPPTSTGRCDPPCYSRLRRRCRPFRVRCR